MTLKLNNELAIGTAIKNGTLSYSEKALDIMKEAVTGNLLGDASLVTDAILSTPKGFSSQLVSSQRQYIDHLYNVYSPWTTAKIYDKNANRKSTVSNKPLDPCWGFITRVQKVLLVYENWREVTPIISTVKKGKSKISLKTRKILPPNIKELLTPRAIAYWFMDDGAIQQLGRKGFCICTDGFREHEVVTLINILRVNYGISCGKSKVKTKKNEIQYRIRIYVDGHDAFRDIVEPYILPCFEYKINPI